MIGGEGGGGGAGVRGCEAADYLHEASACEGQKWGAKSPLAPPPPQVPPPLYRVKYVCVKLHPSFLTSELHHLQPIHSPDTNVTE